MCGFHAWHFGIIRGATHSESGARMDTPYDPSPSTATLPDALPRQSSSNAESMVPGHTSNRRFASTP
jgi:hypothetical protein